MPGHPRPPRRDAAPEGARRHPRRPRTTRPTRPTSRPLRHRADRPRRRRTSTRSRPAPGIEMIDVGGPAMVRAAAKNHAHVGVVVDPVDYGPVLDELRRRRRARRPRPGGRWPARPSPTPPPTTPPSSTWLDESAIRQAPRRCRPRSTSRSSGPRSCATARTRTSRAPATGVSGPRSWWDDAVQHGGKELSYLNLFDAEAAWRLVHRFERPARGGHRQARQPVRRRRRRRRSPPPTCAPTPCDPVSAFGGIVAVNRRVPRPWPRRWRRCSPRSWWRPAFRRRRPGGAGQPRRTCGCCRRRRPARERSTCASIDGGLLVQEPDPVVARPLGLAGRHEGRARRRRSGTTSTLAWQVCAAVSSNAIVLVRDGQAVGIGAGQQNRRRLGPHRRRARRRDGRPAVPAPAMPSSRSATASTSPPRPACAAVVQPGGSVRDDEVIAAADEHGIAMVFTGERHFRH